VEVQTQKLPGTGEEHSLRSICRQKVSITTLKDGSTSSDAATREGFLLSLTDQAYHRQERDRQVRLGTTSSTIHRRGGNPGEKMVREMLEQPTVPEGKDD